MTRASAWLGLAASAESAASFLREEFPRSSANRAYYSCFASCHALLSHLRPSIDWPGRGHFKHGDLPAELRWTLLRLPGFGPYKAAVYKDLLETAYHFRRVADYQPQMPLAEEAVRRGVEGAGSMLRLAKEIVK